jgi:uncharacterized membrane protein affecting hemolysin expression
MALFGFTSPDVFNYHQKENDEPLVFNTSIIKNMEITQETKDNQLVILKFQFNNYQMNLMKLLLMILLNNVILFHLYLMGFIMV